MSLCCYLSLLFDVTLIVKKEKIQLILLQLEQVVKFDSLL